MAKVAKPKKEISMEEALWKSADKLRGSVEPAEYKHVVLSLFFLKFASDKFQDCRNRIIANHGERFADMKPFYAQENVFYLPEESRWSYIMENAKQDDIALKIDTALYTIEKNNPSLKGALPDNYYSRLHIDTAKLASLLDEINKINTDDKENDIIGRVYIHFYCAVRSILFKLTKGDAPDIAQMNARVREMLEGAIQSDGIEELFETGKHISVDIFSDEYMDKINAIQLPNTIRYDTLYTYVLLRVQHWTKAVREDEKKLLESILKAGDKERAAAMKKHTAELAKAEKRKTEVDRLFAKMYEDRVSERITEYNFNMLSQKYQMEQLELDEKIQKLKAALSESKQSVEDAKKWIEIVKQYSEPTELTAELLNNMINKIVVHEAVKYDNGFREQKIEIYYRFVGKID